MGRGDILSYHHLTEKRWDGKHESGWGREQGETKYLRDFIEKQKDEIGPEVLDIGSGQGRNLVPLAEQGFNVTGLDISKEGLDITKERLEKEGVKANLVQGKTSELPFNDRSFDFVFSIGTIHHNKWEDIEKSFQEASRVLKNNKYFLFQGRSINDTARPREQIEDHGYTAVDLAGNKEGVVQHYFTEEELKKLAADNGFKIVIKPEETIKAAEETPERKRARFWVVFQKEEASSEKKKSENKP